jgi:hypothetical protein
MSFPFDPERRLIIARTELEGPSGNAVLRLALDTGATRTLINVGLLVSIGYDPALTAGRSQITTGSGVEFVPHLPLSKITALGQERTGFSVLVTRCHRARVLTDFLAWTSFAA